MDNKELKKKYRDENPSKIKQTRDNNYIKRKDIHLSATKKYKASIPGRYQTLIRTCRKKNILCTLTFEQYNAKISNSVCFYHKGSLDLSIGTGYLLDKINPSLGYTEENTVPCCRVCNDLKGANLSSDQALDVVTSLIKKDANLFNKISTVEKEISSVEREILKVDIDILLDEQLSSLLVSKEKDKLFFKNLTVVEQTLDKNHIDPKLIKKAYTNTLIFRSNEILEKTDIIRSILKHKIGITQNKLAARKCLIAEIPTEMADLFFIENHLMGKNPSPSLGMYYKDLLVAVFSYKMSKWGNKALTINRFSVKKNYSIVGAFSKFIECVTLLEQPVSITSFVDLRYHQGSSYESAGFKLINDNPSWSWTDGKSTFNRLRCRANMDSRNLSEKGYALELGLWKIEDAGQAKYTKYIDLKSIDGKILIIKKSEEANPKQEIQSANAGLQDYYKLERLKGYTKCQNILKEAGMELITTYKEYEDQKNKKRIFKIKCPQGHLFERNQDRAKQLTSCPICKGVSNKSEAFIDKLSDRGWKWVSGSYQNKNSYIVAECIKGHVLTRQYRWFRDCFCPTCIQDNSRNKIS